MENVFALTTVEKRNGVEGAKTTRDTSRDCVKGWTPAPVRCPPDMLARPYGFYASRNGSGGYGKNAENSPVAHGKVAHEGGGGRGGRARARARSLTRGSNLEATCRPDCRIVRFRARRGTPQHRRSRLIQRGARPSTLPLAPSLQKTSGGAKRPKSGEAGGEGGSSPVSRRAD
jgi:hypothetical protein